MKPGWDYLLNAIGHTPVTLNALLSARDGGDPVWEGRTDPDRFRLREVVAHLADWEAIFRERLERIVTEEHPLLLRPDPDERARAQGYATADPHECLLRFAARRTETVAWLRTLETERIERTGHLDRLGDLSLHTLVVLILGHDAYHLRQTAESLQAAT
ncbi:MAG: DinB family protein [Capsulimonadales bacterium]|nr:DinB family protein [Capsulimonadales bacterium]